MMTLFWILLPFAAALSAFVAPPGAWYAALQKPAWNPPPWAFAPVWMTLYLLMGIAAAMVWRAGTPARRWPLMLFGAQLALNALWSLIFFRWHLMGWAVVELAALCVAVAATAAAFFRVRRVAGVLLLPYLAWGLFALILNFTIWRLN